MSKIRISELEKTNGVDRKDIIAFLNTQGIEAKTASNSIDEDAVALVTKHFAKASPASAKPAPRTAPVPAGTVKKAAPASGTAAGNVKTPQAAAPATGTEAPAAKPSVPSDNTAAPASGTAAGVQAVAKKKKRIIIVTAGNAGNHGTQQAHRPAGGYTSPAARSGGQESYGRNQRTGSDRGTFSTQVHRIIKPKTAPSQMEVDFHKPTEADRNAEAKRIQEAEAREKQEETAKTVSQAAQPSMTEAPAAEVKKAVETPAAKAPVSGAAEASAAKTAETPAAGKAEMPAAKAPASGAAETPAAKEPAAKAPAAAKTAETAAEKTAAAPVEKTAAADTAAAKTEVSSAKAPAAGTQSAAPAGNTAAKEGPREGSSEAAGTASAGHQSEGSLTQGTSGRRIYTNTRPSADRGYGNRSSQGSGNGSSYGNRNGSSYGQGGGSSYGNRSGSSYGQGSGNGSSYGQGSGNGSSYGNRGGSSYGNRSGSSYGQGGGSSYGNRGGSSYGQGGGSSYGNRGGSSYGQGGGSSYGNRGGSSYGQGGGSSYGNRGGSSYGNRGGSSYGQGGGSSYGNRGGSSYGQGRPGQGGYGNRRPAGPGRGPATGGDTFVKDAEKHRDESKRRIGQEKDRRNRKDLAYEEQEKNRPGRFIRPEENPEANQEEKIKTISVPEKITVHDLADRMHMQPSEIIKKLFLEKNQILTPNSELTYKEVEDIAITYDILCEKEEKVDVIEELLKEDDDDEKDLVRRPPVICVMGHVDHGKTSLLDKIRSTHVTDREAGGITQAIGAYTVNVKGRTITFLDTPGHEAFTAMRMRGANSTDIAVLVVAADDGVMPQTIEAINHAKAAGIEIIVAVNKIDKPNANVDLVKQELTKYELVSTDWGGTTEFVPVSAKTGQGIDDLLETILLTADILELKANPNRLARGLVLEAKLDKGRGPVANILIQKGTIHIGDFISAGASYGKVRALIDDKGEMVREAGPSMPVEVLGMNDVPMAGEVLVAHDSDKSARSYVETFRTQHKEDLLEETRMRMSLDDLFSQMKEGKLKEFDVIIKADVQGSAEALKQSLVKLSNEEIVVKCIHSGVGAISESDVSLASASNAVIIGFNVRPDPAAKAMADTEGVDVRLYKVIYEAIDAVSAALKGMEAPVYEEQVIGHAEVRQLFHASQVGNIAGSSVTDGVIRRGCKVRITRGGDQIFEGSLASLKRFKDDAKEVKEGFECGLVFDGFDAIQPGDIVEAYDMVQVPKK
jgi:translation initiation factor IF-2